jgi:hypothetical protein
MLTAFVVFQLALDALLVLFLAIGALRRAAAPPPPDTPPEWYRELVALSQDVLLATEPMLDALERREAPPARTSEAGAAPARTEPPPAPSASALKSERHRQAFALLHAGARDDEVIRASGLASWELKLIKNILATESVTS